jgi:hypothetical protein
MFLLDAKFQKPSGVIEHVCLMLSRAVSLLSNNQPSLLQNTRLIRHPRGVIGGSFIFCLYFQLCTLHFFSPRRSNYACLLRQKPFFRTFAAVVKSSIADFAQKGHLQLQNFDRRNAYYADYQPSPQQKGETVSNSLLYHSQHLFVFTLYFVLCTIFCLLLITRYCLFPPSLWHDWRPSATKYPFPPHFQHVLPVLAALPAILPAPPLPPQQKSEPFSDSLLSFTLHFQLCTLH